jgi:LPXTG-site transpeptidase (sortase) family protein
MNSVKTLLKRTLLIVVLAGVAASPAIVYYFNVRPVQSNPTTFTASTTPLYQQETIKQAEVSFGLPVRLKIPKISVDAAIDPMSLASNGDLEAPSGPRNVGWYRFGPRPGDRGSAVIDGHYGPWKNGEKSVFDNLNGLTKGDSLYVEDSKGTTITFVVREFRTYGQNDDVPDVFISNDGKAHLNLITCQGIWNKTQQTYSNRLVVFADKKVE